jgi:hypothetical protein
MKIGNSSLNFWRRNIEGGISCFLKNSEGANLKVLCTWTKVLD